MFKPQSSGEQGFAVVDQNNPSWVGAGSTNASKLATAAATTTTATAAATSVWLASRRCQEQMG